ncbi:hypothetical protein BHU72_10860 [Desulfuribacillus stibiiarsenatis]|uniref:Selenium-dependent hydroxylase accessory protein YqeC n=1 Tax=Desulfuribacillus stibiiarsenatis TaxID=1390249 RepID=A0A1E5L2G7_9FIRM|nr:selenium cofactor biosynthesis protein YqeC [Desulfuribacillus stibiiarsenatis]OEH84306.1 hypothetical protein BHU72_10860 [Desulfuribacillus stibiiarsenatis]
MNLLDSLAIPQSGIYTAVGAGGKTSLLQSVALELYNLRLPLVLTTTTRMLAPQLHIDTHMPLPTIIISDVDKSARYIQRFLTHFQCAGWGKRYELQKVVGHSKEHIDQIYQTLADEFPSLHFLVEGDGANHRLLKAPAEHEPVVPDLTKVTLGVLSLQAIGMPLNHAITHRLAEVSLVLNTLENSIVTLQDIIELAVHPNGIFARTKGRKVLVLSGANACCGTHTIQKLEHSIREALSNAYGQHKLNSVESDGIVLDSIELDSIVITTGFGTAMRPLSIITTNRLL